MGTDRADVEEATRALRALRLLSEREHQVLELVGRDHTYPRIGDELEISPRTVHTYVERLVKKLPLPPGRPKVVLSRFARRYLEGP